MRKENKLTKVAIFALLVAIIAIILVSGTYARYTTQLTGTDSVQIAKWAWNVSGADITSGITTYKLDLFSTIKDTDLTAETDVAAKRIAPGTRGEFTIVVTNNSEVNAQYSVSFAENNPIGAHIEYSTDGFNWAPVESLDVPVTAVAQGATVNVPIKWRWAYNLSDQQNEDDTLVGFNAQTPSTIEVEATLNLVQVD